MDPVADGQVQAAVELEVEGRLVLEHREAVDDAAEAHAEDRRQAEGPQGVGVVGDRDAAHVGPEVVVHAAAGQVGTVVEALVPGIQVGAGDALHQHLVLEAGHGQHGPGPDVARVQVDVERVGEEEADVEAEALARLDLLDRGVEAVHGAGVAQIEDLAVVQGDGVGTLGELGALVDDGQVEIGGAPVAAAAQRDADLLYAAGQLLFGLVDADLGLGLGENGDGRGGQGQQQGAGQHPRSVRLHVSPRRRWRRNVWTRPLERNELNYGRNARKRPSARVRLR